MAPWWSRPTAEGAAEAPEPEPEPELVPGGEPELAEPPSQAPGAPSTATGAPAAPSYPPPPPGPAGARSAAAPSASAALAGLDEDDEEAAAAGSAGPEGAHADAPEGAPEAPVTEKRRRRRNGRGRGGAGGSGDRAEARPAAAPALEPRPRVEARREGAAARERDAETIPMGVPQIQDLIKEILVAVPDRPSSAYEERKLALFCDLENVALGARDSGINFDINLVLERLLEKGKIIVKKAYADWNRYGDYKRPFHEAGIELIDIPQRSYSGKNSADIKMVVDAMDISYAKEHLDTFVLLSGDSDFSPLVSKLKENDKYVIGVGVKGSSSNLLIDNCDEFIYYEDIWRDVERVPKLDALPKKEQELFALLVEAVLALQRENKDVLWGSMIKQTMQRKRPSFSEGYYGYSTFSELLEDAERKNIVKLKKDQRSGSYIVTGFASRRR